MRDWLFPVLMVAGLSGCAEKPPEPIYLFCKGEVINVGKPNEEGAYLWKIEEATNSMGSYNDIEKRFRWDCNERGFRCSLEITPEIITEQAIALWDEANRPTLVRTTKINRITGEVAVTMTDKTMGTSSVFNGTCRKTVEPERVAPKF